MTSPITDYVTKSARRRDGQWILLTRNGHSALSSEPMEEGQQVVITESRAERVKQPGGVHP